MNKKLKVIFISIFLLILFLPLCLGIVYGADVQALHREPAPMPAFRGINYLGDYQKFITDRLGLKGKMIKTANAINVLGFKDNQGNDIIYGDEGYFFWAEDCIRKDMLGERILTQEEQSNIKEKQYSVADQLADMSIKYLLVIVPDKQSIYSEYVPQGMYRESDNKVKSQVINLLSGNKNIEILDLKEAFLKEKANQALYLQDDGHWNLNGSFIGYTEITKKLKEMGFQNIPLMRQDEFDIVHLPPYPGGNLADMLKLTDYVRENNGYTYTKKTPVTYHEAQTGDYEDPSIYPIEAGYGMQAFESDNADLPRAVVLKDSFGGYPGAIYGDVPFLAEDFSRSVFFSTSAVNFDIIQKEKPDVVILQVAEYYLPTRLVL